MYIENEELDQERLPVTLSLYQSTGQVVYPEQMSVYNHLARRLKDKNILEIGCGIGCGSALLSLNNKVLGTDKLSQNVLFAKALYPWVQFEKHDIVSEIVCGFDITICVDVIEHIKDYRAAISNLLKTAKEVWISTPNRNNLKLGQDRPVNDYHVKEFTPEEMILMIDKKDVEIYRWDNFNRVGLDSTITPLVYKI